MSENQVEKVLHHHDIMKPTKNKFGFQLEIENPYVNLAMKQMDKSKRVLELGAAYGFTSNIMLDNGFRVITNDLDPKHLDVFWASVDDEKKTRLELRPGDVMELNFEPSSLAGVVALNILLFLSGDQIRTLLRRAHDWLIPNGSLVIQVASPLMKAHDPASLQREYYERFRRGDEWPGVFDVKLITGPRENILQVDQFNLICLDVLLREVHLAGFKVVKAEYFDIDIQKKHFDRDGLGSHLSNVLCVKK